jgi:hypothetical protein
VDVQTLSRAVEAYKISNGEYPSGLDDLAKKQPGGGPALVEAGALKDPWGKPYSYDPAGPKNAGLKPDIWSAGGGKVLIGNWPAPKTKPPKAEGE